MGEEGIVSGFERAGAVIILGYSVKEGLQDGYIKFGPLAIVVPWCVTGVTVGWVIFTTQFYNGETWRG